MSAVHGSAFRARYAAAVLLTLVLATLCVWAATASDARAGTADTVSAPTLTSVADSPFATGGSEATGLSYSPNGDYVATSNRFAADGTGGSLAIFSASQTGSLTPISGSPFADTTGEPGDVAFDPDGEYLAVVGAVSSLPNGDECSCVSTYSVASDGTPTLVSGSSAAPPVGASQIEDIAFNPDGNVLVASTPFSLVAFAVAGNGDLTEVSDADLPKNGLAAGSIAINPAGNLVAVADTSETGSAGNVDLFSLNSGKLTYLSTASSGSGAESIGVAFSPDGNYLAVANESSSSTSIFAVGDDALTPVPGSPFTESTDPDGDPVAVLFNPAGWLAVIQDDSYVYTYTLASDGALDEPGNNAEGTGGSIPQGDAFSPSGQFLDIVDDENNDINVLGTTAPPTAVITTPASSGGTYTVGQSVPTVFSCADATGAPGIASCTDSNGATDGKGALNTSAAGSFTYTVTAVSQDGQSGSAKLTYTVTAATTTTSTTPSTTTTTKSTSTGTTTPPVGAGSGTAQKVSASGSTASTTLTCAGASTQTCSLTLTVTTQVSTKTGKRISSGATKPKVKTVVIGSLSVKLRGGTKRVVKLTLNLAGRKLLAKDHRLAATIKITEGKKLVRSQRLTFTATKVRSGRERWSVSG